MFEKIDVWYISCSTGCTCCSYENFDYGYYTVEDEALRQRNLWLDGIDNPLGSQYAKYGRYRVCKTEAELLPDGRMIIDGDSVSKQDSIGRIY